MSEQLLIYGIKVDTSGGIASFNDFAAALKRSEEQFQKLTQDIEKYKNATNKAVAATGEKSNQISRLVGSLTDGSHAFKGLNKDLSGMNTLLADSGVEIPHAEMAIKMLTNPVVLLAAATVGAAIAAGKFALDIADLVEHLSILEATTGITIDQLYGIRDIAMSSGVDFDSLAKAASKMETELGKGNKELKSLGLTGNSSIEDIARVADAWNKATTTAEKNRIAMAAFGKGFQDMIPLLQQGGDAIRSVGEAKQIDLQKFRTLDETVDGISQAWRDIKFSIGDIAAGPLDVALSGFKKILDVVRETADGWDAILSRKGGTNAGLAENFLSRYTSKSVETYNHGSRRLEREVLSVGSMVDQLKADFASLPVQERLRILDGIYNLDKSTASAAMRSLFGTNGQINGLPVADLAAMTKTANIDKKAAPPETQEEIDARKAAAEKELSFQRDLRRQLAELTAESDQKELIALQNKYAKLLDEHKKYASSRLLIEEAQRTEIMRLNFSSLAKERDADQSVIDFSASEDKRVFQITAADKDEARAVRKMQSYGLVGENGVGIYDTSQMDLNEMNEAIKNYESTLDPAVQKTILASAEMQDQIQAIQEAWQGAANVIANDFGNRVSNAFIAMQHGTQDLAHSIKSILVGSLENVEAKVISLATQYAVLTAISGGAAPAGLGFIDFIVKGIGGHAAGTLSSPGGLKFLGEQGNEPFETPQGQRGIATYGLYYVPTGTRVTQSSSPSNSPEKHYHLHSTESDPIQVGEQFRRVIRDEISLYDSETYRQRSN